MAGTRFGGCAAPFRFTRPLPSGGGGVAGGGVDFADLPGGVGQVGVVQLRGHIVFFGLGEEPAEPQWLIEKRQGDVYRPLPLLDPQRELPAAQGRTDVIVAAHAERIEAERLLPLARDRN